MGKVELQSIITRNKAIMSADMDGETVMMSIDTSKYYNLGKTGGAIWKILEEPMQAEEIITTLMESYQLTKEQGEKDVLPFLQKMLNQQLISIS